jgi:hypothetical protein
VFVLGAGSSAFSWNWTAAGCRRRSALVLPTRAENEGEGERKEGGWMKVKNLKTHRTFSPRKRCYDV